MIKKSYKKDLLNSEEELVSSKLEEPVKLKLEKSKTELPMLFVPPELLSKKDLLLEEDVLYFMPHNLLKILKEKISTKMLVLILLEKLYKFLAEL
jgi:hypothetical protein